MNWVKCRDRLPPKPQSPSSSKRYIVITDDGAAFAHFMQLGWWRNDEGCRLNLVYYWLETPDVCEI